MKQLNPKELKNFYKQNNLKHDKDIVIILENIQYARNVASFFRTADALKVSKIYLTGISKTPPLGKDLKKASRNKELTVPWEYVKDITRTIEKLKTDGFTITALEITDKSIPYNKFNYPKRIAIIAGSEVYGVTKEKLEQCDNAVYIPMYGKGKSLNVHVALAILCYHIISL